MNLPTKAALCAATLLATQAVCHGAPGYCSDPLVTHTNGMRLASTTSTRNHNVYWQCESGHVGYCDGKLRSPCRDDWRSLGTRCRGRYVPPYTPMGPTKSDTIHSMDGLEQETSVSLGRLVQTTGPAGNDRRAPVGRASAAPPALSPVGGPTPAPAVGSNWLDAVQSIGKKMMAAP